jgi:phosphoribosylanthranilate isomerase
MLVKLCGFTEQLSLEVAIKEGCNFIGFVFCKESIRYISPKDASLIAKSVPLKIPKVAVVVDPNLNFLDEIYQNLLPDFFQFHGNESVDFIRKVKNIFPKIKIIKAFRVSKKIEFDLINSFTSYVDYFLFDSKKAGSGESFDWNLLDNLSFKKDWFLSGGINENNLEIVLKNNKVKMIDISSGIERIRGKKSPELIRNLMKKVRNYAT